jgi:hypothetical protein
MSQPLFSPTQVIELTRKWLTAYQKVDQIMLEVAHDVANGAHDVETKPHFLMNGSVAQIQKMTRERPEPKS